MDVVNYINDKIKKIDNEIIHLIDHDHIMSLKLKKEAYLVYLELLSIRLKIKFELKLSDKLDTSSSSEVLKMYGFKLSFDSKVWEYIVDDYTSLLIKNKNEQVSNLEDYKIYFETTYKECIQMPDILCRMIGDGLLI